MDNIKLLNNKGGHAETSLENDECPIMKHRNALDASKQSLKKRDAIRHRLFARRQYDNVQADLTSSSLQVQCSALIVMGQMLEFHKDRIDVCLAEDIPHLLFQISFGETQEVQSAARRCVQLIIESLVLRNQFDPVRFFNRVAKYESQDDALKLLQELIESDVKPQHVARWQVFTYEVVVHLMYLTDDAIVRQWLIKLGFCLVQVYPVHTLSATLLRDFKIRVETIYITTMGKLLETQSRDWHQLCIFVFVCFGKLLHIAPYISITNVILKYLEGVFRTSQSEKLLALECWKGLIDNCGLNLERMKVDKQIRLLVTPLRSNISRTPEVIDKRFELWAHLLDVLKEHSSLCIMYFLDFCFGPFEEVDTIISIRCSARKIPSMWERITHSMFELIGHHGHDAENCVVKTNLSPFRLEKPLINHKNYEKLKDMLIVSLSECLLLMPKWMDKNLIDEAVKCLVGSFLNVIYPLNNEELRKDELRKLGNMLIKFLKECNVEEIGMLVIPMLEVFSAAHYVKSELFLEHTILPIIKDDSSFNRLLSSQDNYVVTLHFLQSCQFPAENVPVWLRRINSTLEKIKANNLAQVDELLEVLISLIKAFPDAYTTKIHKETESVLIINKIMLWIVSKLHLVEEQSFLIVVVQSWSNIFAQLYSISPEKSTDIILGIQNNMKSSANFSNGIVLLLPEFKKLLINNTRAGTMLWPLVNVILNALVSPDITENGIDLCEDCLTVIVKLCSLNKFKSTLQEDMFLSLCRCFELLYTKEKLSILKTMLQVFEVMPKRLIERTPQVLKQIMDRLCIHRNPDVVENAMKLSEILQSTLSNSLSPETSKQCPKIKANIVSVTKVPSSLKSEQTQSRVIQVNNASSLNTSPSTKNSPKVTTSNLLNFVGIFASGSSPTISGSQMNKENGNKSQKRKTKNLISNKEDKLKKNNSNILLEDDDANYVLINEKVRFDPEKMSDHQLETFKNPRTDIPALYQDLTQSQSNSQIVLAKMKLATTSDDSGMNGNPPQATTLQAEYDRNSAQGKATLYQKNESSTKSKILRVYKMQKRENVTNRVHNNSVDPVKSLFENESHLKNITNESLSQDNFNLPSTSKQSGQQLIDLTDNVIEQTPLQPNIEANENLKQCDSPKKKKASPSKKNNFDNKGSVGNPILPEKIKEVLASTSSNKKNMDSVFKELSKLTMNIVGGEQVLQQLDISDARKTRRSVDLLKVTMSPEPGRRLRKRRQSETSSNTYILKNMVNNRNEPSENLSKLVANVNKDTRVNSELSNIIPKTSQEIISVNDNLGSDNNSVNAVTPVAHSEDVIESSQESLVQIAPHSNCASDPLNPSSSSSVFTEEMPTLKKILDTSELTNMVKIEDNLEADEEAKRKNCLSYSNISENVTFEIVGDSMPDALSPNELMNCDLEVKNENTEEMDTETLDVVQSSPLKQSPQQNISIVTSPVGKDTPTRTKELMDNTWNISPIKSLLKVDVEEKSLTANDLIANKPLVTAATSKDEEPNKQVSLDETSSCSMIKKLLEPTTEPESADLPNKILYNGNTRSAKLLNFINKSSPSSNILLVKKLNKHITIGEKSSKTTYSSPKTNRIAKMMQKCEKISDENQEKIDEPNNEPEEVLRFVRPLPGPEASPHCGILKRKAPDSKRDDSPPRKIAKKVNFPDPPLTCERYYIVDENERSHINIDDGDMVMSAAGLFDSEENTSPEVVDNVETSTSQQEHDVSFEDEEPIFPRLVNSKIAIQDSLDSLADPSFKQTLVEELKEKKIQTVGDLALLNQREINRLPFRVPKVDEVRKVLLQVYKSKNQVVEKSHSKSQDNENSIKNNSTVDAEVVAADETILTEEVNTQSLVKINGALNKDEEIKEIDPTEAFKSRFDTAVSNLENVLRETPKDLSLSCYDSILKIMDSRTLISMLQQSRALSIDDLIENNNWSSIVSQIISKMEAKVIKSDVLITALSSTGDPCSTSTSATRKPDLQKFFDLLKDGKNFAFDRLEFFKNAILQLRPSFKDLSDLALENADQASEDDIFHLLNKIPEEIIIKYAVNEMKNSRKCKTQHN